MKSRKTDGFPLKKQCQKNTTVYLQSSKGPTSGAIRFGKKNSNTVLVVLVNNHDEDNFVVGPGGTINGEWTTVPMMLKGRMHVAYWMPFPKFEPKEVKDE